MAAIELCGKRAHRPKYRSANPTAAFETYRRSACVPDACQQQRKQP
jgi:hypothetical protein